MLQKTNSLFITTFHFHGLGRSRLYFNEMYYLLVIVSEIKCLLFILFMDNTCIIFNEFSFSPLVKFVLIVHLTNFSVYLC